MDTKTQKKKLCWNCEADVDLDAENCLYCGVYLYPENTPKENREPEPEKVEAFEEEEKDEEVPEAPFAQLDDEDMVPTEEDFITQVKKEKGEVKGIVLPVLFLLAGILFFIFGILMYFYQKNGVLTLQWNANYWFVYLFFSFPLMYIGWRTLQYIEEQEEE